MILILSGPLDQHATHVAEKLRERGASFLCFDPARFPREAEISLTHSPTGHYQPILRTGNRNIDLSQVSAAWYRRPQKPIAHDVVRDRAARAFVELECHMVVQDLWHSLECEWLPAPPFLEIHTQVTNHTRHDWRRYDHGRTPHFPHTLPSEIEARCIRLCECLGLRYGAIDMVLTPDGRYVFLEINPNGQYLWIEHETGIPISDAICDILMENSSVQPKRGFYQRSTGPAGGCDPRYPDLPENDQS